jgi:predicted RNA-binding Zn-ribbon protein involved in translation (DUF1610 family)
MLVPLLMCALAIAVLDGEQEQQTRATPCPRRRRRVVDQIEVAHSHKCPRCGWIWEHPTRQLGHAEDEARHRCPRCGTESREKFTQTFTNIWA